MPIDIQTILVATDFSTASEAAMTYACHLARSLGARVTLLHVVPESDVEVVPCMRTRRYTSPARRSSTPSMLQLRNSSPRWLTAL